MLACWLSFDVGLFIPFSIFVCVVVGFEIFFFFLSRCHYFPLIRFVCLWRTRASLKRFCSEHSAPVVIPNDSPKNQLIKSFANQRVRSTSGVDHPSTRPQATARSLIDYFTDSNSMTDEIIIIGPPFPSSLPPTLSLDAFKQRLIHRSRLYEFAQEFIISSALKKETANIF